MTCRWQSRASWQKRRAARHTELSRSQQRETLLSETSSERGGLGRRRDSCWCGLDAGRLQPGLRPLHLLAVEVVKERVDDVSEDEGPGSSQAVLHLRQQQRHKQVVGEQDAMALVAVGGLRCSLAHGQQDPLDGDLGERGQVRPSLRPKEGGARGQLSCLTGVLDRTATRDPWLVLWHLLR